MSGLNRKISERHELGVRAFVEEESAVIREAHFSGSSGAEVVQRRTALIDRLLRAIYAEASPAPSMPLLMAVGGYGRGELNPFSDIDVMFLCRDEAERRRSLDILYKLWDAGLDVGYSVRTIPECVDLARKEIRIRTSLMESRLIAGAPDLFNKFRSVMSSEVFFWKTAAFISEKIADRRQTQQKYGSSIYLREPNIKEGAGGLRDVHTALWLAFVHFRVSSLEELVPRGIISDEQYPVFGRSRGFLWRLRNELHYLSGRKNDHLTFDLQERAASDFGYRDSTHLLAVERFMKAYFHHARNIREFSSIVMDAVLRKPSRHLFSRARQIGKYHLVGKILAPCSDTLFQEDPAQILAAFRITQSRHAAFSGRLRSMIRGFRLDESFRADPSAAAGFIDIMNNLDGLHETLSLMKDLHYLGRLIPEFRAIQSLARHDAYHKFTVDEHTLLAIRNIQDLWYGLNPGLSVLGEALKAVPTKWVLTLAVLLHDLGKAFKHGHEHRGVELAERVLGRLGVAGGEKDRIIFLIRNHLLMAGISQRRELDDRKVIAAFARQVHDRENLDMLYLLTYADIAAVSPTAWTQWKAILLQDMYLRTRDYLGRKAVAEDEERARLEAARERLRKAAEGVFTPQELEAFLGILPDKYVLYTPSQKALGHVRMMKRLRDEQPLIEHAHYPERGYTELTICAYDAYGMFYRAAGTIAAKNLSILRAQVFTTRDGVMIDTFQVTDSDGYMCPYDDVWESLKYELQLVLSGVNRVPEPSASSYGRAAPGEVASAVEFDNDSSDAFTIIDITARDRVGLLYSITRTFYELNLDIASAKIVTEGVRVMDSFYVSDLFRRKITDEERLERIRGALLKVL